MGQGVKRTLRDYSLTFKLALVEQIEKGELTYKQSQVRYGIQGNSTVLVRAGRSITMTDPDNQMPEQRINELEQQLALMSQKAQFFEAVVDVLCPLTQSCWLKSPPLQLLYALCRTSFRIAITCK